MSLSIKLPNSVMHFFKKSIRDGPDLIKPTKSISLFSIILLTLIFPEV